MMSNLTEQAFYAGVGTISSFVVVLSLITGGLFGEFCGLQDHMNRLGDNLKARLKIGNANFTEGMVTAFLLFCMGTMTILGSVEEGLTGNMSDLLKTKSLMDSFSSLLLASALGIGAVVLELHKDFPDAKILLLGIFPRSTANNPVRKIIAEINSIISRLHDGKRVFYLDIVVRGDLKEGQNRRFKMRPLYVLRKASAAAMVVSV